MLSGMTRDQTEASLRGQGLQPTRNLIATELLVSCANWVWRLHVPFCFRMSGVHTYY